jgi:hypothetical protein
MRTECSFVLPERTRTQCSTVYRTWHRVAGAPAGPGGQAATCEATTGYACGPTACWRSRGQPSSPSHLAVAATSWPPKTAPRTPASYTGGRTAARPCIYTGCPPMDSSIRLKLPTIEKASAFPLLFAGKASFFLSCVCTDTAEIDRYTTCSL